MSPQIDTTRDLSRERRHGRMKACTNAQKRAHTLAHSHTYMHACTHPALFVSMRIQI